MYKITCVDEEMNPTEFNVDEENEREAMHAAATQFWKNTHSTDFLIYTSDNRFRIMVEPLFMVMPVEMDD